MLVMCAMTGRMRGQTFWVRVCTMLPPLTLFNSISDPTDEKTLTQSVLWDSSRRLKRTICTYSTLAINKIDFLILAAICVLRMLELNSVLSALLLMKARGSLCYSIFDIWHFGGEGEVLTHQFSSNTTIGPRTNFSRILRSCHVLWQ